jgi:hypothetical protein
MREASLPGAINYYADYGGCGFWRMIWPEFLMNVYNKACMSGLTQMILDLRFYNGIKAIRMQRQATPVQNSFVKELKKAQKELGFRLIYEVDDIVFKDDIPDYNRCKEAFVDQSIIDSILSIMQEMDEITVTCDYMKEYYQHKTGNKNITVIPNYAPKFWLDRFYNKERIQKLYEKNKKRPRVLYSGSGTHVDVLNKTNFNDDFSHVVNDIIKAGKRTSVRLFDDLDKDTALNIYSFLSNNKSILHLSQDILDVIRDIVVKKYDNVEIYKLNPSINDLINNNLYKLYVHDELFLVPLWHNESYFDGSGCEIIVICEPELPYGIKIDDDNNICIYYSCC